MTKILVYVSGGLLLTTLLLGLLWRYELKANGKLEAEIAEAVSANEALLQAAKAWEETVRQRDAILSQNRRDRDAISHENSRLQKALRDATRGDDCAATPAPDVARLFQAGDEGRDGGSLPADKPD